MIQHFSVIFFCYTVYDGLITGKDLLGCVFNLAKELSQVGNVAKYYGIRTLHFMLKYINNYIVMTLDGKIKRYHF